MKNSRFPKPLLQMILFVTAGGAAFAQNSDLGLLLGVIDPHYSVVTGPGSSVSAGAGAAGQINYAYQIKGWQAADLYLEFPFFLAGRGDTYSAPGIASTNANGIGALTPGPRLKVRLGGRISFYAAAGGGFGWYGNNEVLSGHGSSTVSGNTTVTGAFDFGGGIDFRLTRLLSLRPEVRDLVTTHRNLYGGSNHNPIYAFGLAFHF